MTVFGQKLRADADAACERLAAAEFTVEKIIAHCSACAREGLYDAEIRPSRPVDVRRTPTAIATTLELRDRRQLQVEWVPIRERADVSPFYALRVSWTPTS